MDKKNLLNRLVGGLGSAGIGFTFFGIFFWLFTNLSFSYCIAFEIAGITLLLVTIILYFIRRSLIVSEIKLNP
jgi:hypothetical protein